MFVYSTYLPPGKHCIIVRDTGTKHYKRYKTNEYEYETENSESSVSKSKERKSMDQNNFYRLSLYKDEKADYFYKDILVAPRQYNLLKVCARPFEPPEVTSTTTTNDQGVFRDWLNE